jgi:anti-sigma regulatory factor (Ser/Thr protein kinase)
MTVTMSMTMDRRRDQRGLMRGTRNGRWQELESERPRHEPDRLHVEVRLPARLDSVRRARLALDHLERTVPETTLDDLRLLVSELVTNSLVHSGIEKDESVDLSVDACDGVVRVEVEDPGPGFACDEPRKPPPERTGGRGLLLVDLIASRWGVRCRPCTCVWFEIDVTR